MSTDGHGTKCCRNIAENFNRLSKAYERYRQTTDRETTDGRATACSEREREFTFGKNVEIKGENVSKRTNVTEIEKKQM